VKTPPHRSVVTRRDFVRTAVVTAAVAPLIVPSRLFGGDAPSNRIRVGHIGCGRIGQSHDMPGVANADLADVLAVCDLDSRRAASGKLRVEQLFAARKAPKPTIDVYGNYHELLARNDIDAVVISLPDHQHAEVAISALRAGKDIYLQKPFTMTHAESVMLRGEVAKTGRILQVGSQQRSWGPNEQFRKACEFVRSGRVGRLQQVEIGLPIDPTKPDDPEQPVPAHFNYEAWLGPTPRVYYTEQRVHPQGLDPKTGLPDVASRPGWLRNES
jgi:myo-inositol 2-dehydrogenase/D-chiro-inositol 1-dehydrogenase